MKTRFAWLCGAWALVCFVELFSARPALAYIEATYSLGRLVQESTNILLIQVESVDRQKNAIIYRKVRDIKGVHQGDIVRHLIGQAGFHPREWKTVMEWAEVGKLAVMFHNGSASETCIDNYWYQAYRGDWWGMSHAEPYLLRTYAGKPERLATLVAAMLTGQEVIVPCMGEADKNACQLRAGKIIRMKASLKILDHNPKRDFVEGGADETETRPIAGMPGFNHFMSLGRLGLEALGVATAFGGSDGKPSFCLFSPTRLFVLQNSGSGSALEEAILPMLGGARAAAWADFDGDGRLDLATATPSGPKLFRYDGKKFEDLSASLPTQKYFHLTAAAWLDYDSDGRPDLLLADGFRGLRLYRNNPTAVKSLEKPVIGPWYYAGPFDNSDGIGFDAVYPPERGVDLAAEYLGKNGEKVVWREGKFRDGHVNNLALFKPDGNSDSVVYLYRELDFGGMVELPVSLGSDDTLTVWLNGEKIYAENVYRPCAADQAHLKLQLRSGKNKLLLKICQGGGDFAFYYAARTASPPLPHLFEDVSLAVGLGEEGCAGTLKGDHLTVADVNGDGRPDVLFSAGEGVLLLNTPKGFIEAKDCGIKYAAGGVTPAFGDFNGDGRPDLFVPQGNSCKLFRNEGQGRFVEVTSRAGALGGRFDDARCGAWADFRRTGRLDLFVGCMNGPNRFFRNNGDGTFTDVTAEIGLHQRIFNTRGIAVADINGDKALDVVFVNAGQEAVALLGNPAWPLAVAAR
jgi:hypothetical protein